MNWDKRIHTWAQDRNLIDGSTPADQMTKLREEVDELIAAVQANDDAGVIDGAGDVCVVLAVMAGQMGTTLNKICDVRPSYAAVYSLQQECDSLDRQFGELGAAIEHQLYNRTFLHIAAVLCQTRCLVDAYCRERAWEQIKDRKGRMVNGIFEKEGE